MRFPVINTCTMKKLILFAELAIACLLFALIYSCSKEDDLAVNPGQPAATDLRTTITGMVFDENDNPLPGVTVTAYSTTAVTGSGGTFLLKDVSVNQSRCLVRFAKAGFMDRVHGFIPGKRGVNYLHIVLTKNVVSHSLASSSGGTVALADKASIVFQPNSFVTAADGKPYSGSVNLAVNHLSPESENFGFMIPGGDLLGIDANGQEVVLYSYGMLEVELTGTGGTALQLAPGAKATINMPISTKQMGKAPSSIPLWSFDESTALWKEEGQATRVGSDYVGEVSHFSTWNCDYKGPRSTIHGRVMDCGLSPMANTIVTIDGWWKTTTDANGEFQNWVPAGTGYDVQVLQSNNPGLTANSQLEHTPALSANQHLTVPDLAIPCHTRVTGRLLTCNGEGSPASIFVTGGGGFLKYIYTVDGSFNIPVTASTVFTFRAYNAQYTKVMYFTSIATPSVQDLGLITLCDSINLQAGNSFTLAPGPFDNERFELTVTSYSAGVNHAGGTAKPFVNLTGKASGFDITLQAVLNDSLVGLTSCVLSGTMVGANTSYSIQTYSNLSCLMSYSVGPVGTPMKGFYAGYIRLSENGGPPINSYISGSFDVLRTE